VVPLLREEATDALADERFLRLARDLEDGLSARQRLASERQPRMRAATELRKPSGMKRMFEEIARQTPQEIGTAELLDTYLQ